MPQKLIRNYLETLYIIENFGIDHYNKHIGKVDYAYNRTINQGWDLFESVYQVANLQELVDKGYDLLSNTKATIHNIDLSAQVDKYKESIKDGHKVLVVAHSQGNLYTQEAYVYSGDIIPISNNSATIPPWHA